VAGIVASNGYSWEKYLIDDRGDTQVSLTDFKWDRSEAGVAPEAKISFDGVNACSGGPPTNAQYWNDQYADGARVMANSWGSNTGTPHDGFATSDDIQNNGEKDRPTAFTAGH